MTDYSCPAKGCDYEADSIGSVKSHIHAKGGFAHEDKDALVATLEKQQDDSGESERQQGDEEQDGSTDEGGQRGSSSATDDDEEQNEGDDGDEQGETTDSEGSEAPSEGDTMPTDEEYSQQRSQSSSQESNDTDDSDDTDQSDDRAGDGSGVPTPSLPVSPWTVGIILATVLILYFVYRYVSGGSESEKTTEEDTDDPAPQETTLVE